ncbi:Sensor protein FixL [Botrimarina colliarenosi]|uniref:histidine kinase n=1 Tax=Botrimarina colliarenosi TaxID=2528001 RepID=A0A5C6AK09_9BACT|nr:ATP-binding protein [Botrimarina colliarenosi]TWT99979.1 Sensor protein FixL [Botrimarina colliarenosi]
MSRPAEPTRSHLADERFQHSLRELQTLTDRVFIYLLLGQWAAAILCAVVISPLTWSGGASSTHVHVLAAVVLGGLLTTFPIWMARKRPGEFDTRIVIASAQICFSALFIHLMGGRTEAHFHIFGSLAVLSFYRDYRVFVPAVSLIFFDHLFRGIFWPQSVFGVASPEVLRVFEHAGWVLFETAFLVWGVAQSRSHLRSMADLQCSLERERDTLDARVNRRTAELTQVKDYLSNVIDSLDAHICILDAQGKIVSTNSVWREFAEARGGDLEKIDAGANYLAACRAATGECQENAARLADAIEAVIEGRRDGYIDEYACHEPDRPRWFQIRVLPFVGGAASVVVSHVDITERVAALDASRADAERAAGLAQIITESPHEIYILRWTDLRFVLVNDGAVRATGYSREELLQMSPVDLVPHSDLDRCLADLEPLIEGRQVLVEFQAEHQRVDGVTYPIQVKVHAAVFNGEQVFVAFITDLSEIRRLEGRLAQAQKLESIGQLAAGIAHEINTPMQCVSNNIEFLQDCHHRFFDIVDRLIGTLDLPAKSWEERKGSVDRLIKEVRYERLASQAPAALEETAEASRRIVDIVRAMKAMSHPGTREFVATDINECLRNSVTIARNRWKYAAELTLDLDDGLPVILALPAELNQVFLNLIVNAADAIVEKSGEGAALGKITLRTRGEGDLVRIEIEDTGGGIPADIRERVFDPFFTTKDVGKGTGQGLAITYDAVVNKHQGTIDLLSTVGVGTTFVVCLPLRLEAAEASSDVPAAVGEA